MLVQCKKVSTQFRGDTLSLFRALGGGERDTVLLESMDGSGTNNVKSLLFVGNALRIEARDNRVQMEVLSPNGARALDTAESSLEKIGDLLPCKNGVTLGVKKSKKETTDEERISARSVVDVLRFFHHSLQPGEKDETLFLPGVFAYDLIDSLEDLPPAKQDELRFPDYVFWVPEQTVVIDHKRDTATAYTWLYGEANQEAVDEKLEEIKAKIDSLAKITDISQTEKSTTPLSEEQVDLDDQEFAALVDAMKAHIRAGDVFQIVPSRTFSVSCPDPLRAYGELRKINPSPYMFVVCGSDFCLFGASPESCVNVSTAPHRLTLRPIAGTRPRGFSANGQIDRDLDNRLEAELKLDEKELAEHMMLVDLARNDVARICIAGSRHVMRLLDVERYSHVMHLVSAVEGVLKPRFDALHAYVGSMNMGTLVGAPKIEAARILREHEKTKRGTYGGAVGYLSSRGELDTAIIIRSAIVKEGIAHVRAGAGVVFDSDPQSEVRETRNKAKAVLLAIQRGKE